MTPEQPPQIHTPESVARAKAVFESLLAEAESVRSRAVALQEQISELEGTAGSAENGVKVRVNAQGALIGLEIDPRAYRKLSPGELAEEILALAGRARAETEQRLGALADQAGLASGPGISLEDLLQPFKMENS